MIRLKLYLLAASALVCVANGALLHEENFDGDLSNWTIEVVSNPHNNEKQYYTDRPVNINVTDGELLITPYRETFGSKQYTSGRMYSTFSWLYGRAEVRAKLPNGYGLWPAIWMLPTDQVFGGWPQSGEIDIMEGRGQDLHEVQSAIHFGGPCCSSTDTYSSGPITAQCRIDEYHVYSMDWTPTELVFRLDGTAFYSVNLDKVLKDVYTKRGDPFHERFHMVLNVAVGGDFLAGPDPDTVWDYPDAQMKVDYVRIHPLEDISSPACRAKASLSNEELCRGVSEACSFPCEVEDLYHYCDPISCCSNPSTCTDDLYENASRLFGAYYRLIGGGCDFLGSGETYVKLNDGTTPNTQCLVSESATKGGLCGSINWACFMSFSNVDASCSAAGDMHSCCGANPDTCDNAILREKAQRIFQEYYDNNPKRTSCDFGGNAFLSNAVEPIACSDGFGAP